MKKKRDKIRLLLIEDNRILREGIISVLKPHRDIRVIAESGKSHIHIILKNLALRTREGDELWKSKIRKKHGNY